MFLRAEQISLEFGDEILIFNYLLIKLLEAILVELQLAHVSVQAEYLVSSLTECFLGVLLGDGHLLVLSLQLLKPVICDGQLALEVLRKLSLPNELSAFLRELTLQIIVRLSL